MRDKHKTSGNKKNSSRFPPSKPIVCIYLIGSTYTYHSRWKSKERFDNLMFDIHTTRWCWMRLSCTKRGQERNPESDDSLNERRQESPETARAEGSCSCESAKNVAERGRRRGKSAKGDGTEQDIGGATVEKKIRILVPQAL